MAGMGSAAACRQLRGLFEGGSAVALEDGQLLARFEADRDSAAFEAIVVRHGPMVLATCRAVLGREHDAEDAFQATFLVLARKAGSIRGNAALGGWLHRVARRASIRAGVERTRRRRKEAEAASLRAEVDRPRPFDLAAQLHREVDRLPDRHRLPVVLCDLEGLSYDEAARQLGLTVPALRNRLARARRRLRDRLGEGGIAAPVPVPPSLAALTLSAATGRSIGSGVELLARAVARGLLLTRIKLASVASLLGLAMIGGLAAGRPAEGPKVAPAPVASAPKPIPVATPKAADLIDVRGIVLDPAGRPVAGAAVYVARPDPFPETTSGPDGRFLLRVPHPDPYSPATSKPYPQVVAAKAGFGLNQAAPPYPPEPGYELAVKLVEEGPAIEGRVLDLEGRPVAGARLEPEAIFEPEAGPLAQWIAQVKQGDLRGFQGLRRIMIRHRSIETTADGRFRLVGLGRERVATLVVTGPTIAQSEARVLLHNDPGFQVTEKDLNTSKVVVYHPSKFDWALPPTKPIEGTVVDAETGQPIEGLTIVARVFEEYSYVTRPAITTTTDVQGRYRVHGLVRAPAYRLSIRPTPGRDLPYVPEERKAPGDSPGFDPVAFDFALKRGVEVRGRVVDRSTGRGVFGTVGVYTYADNPNLGGYPGYNQGNQAYSRTDEDGRYRFVTVPGRAVFAFRAARDNYRNALEAESIAGYDPKAQTVRNTIPGSLYVGNYHAFAGADLPPGPEPAKVDLVVEPGGMVEFTAVDPEERPLVGLRAEGMTPQTVNISASVPPGASTVRVIGLEPGKPRRVVVYHDARKLVGSAWLTGEESGRLTVKLNPWGSIEGRFVAAEDARERVRFIAAANNLFGTKTEEIGILPGAVTGSIRVGRDGRFRVDGLVPGLKYAGAGSVEDVLVGDLFKSVTVAPGEVKDLGDLPVTPYRP
jgi:RNA polymerase sigma factor (sigma-70 family)